MSEGLKKHPPTITEGLSTIANLIGDRTNILPTDLKPKKMVVEHYQTALFKRAGLGVDYPTDQIPHDESIYIVSYPKKLTIVVCGGKISSKSPYEVMYDGLDLRESAYTVCVCQNGTITAYDHQGNVQTYEGDNGKVQTLLFWTRQTFGTKVEEIKFSNG